MAGFAEDLKRIPMSQGLGATLTRAADYAQAQGHGEVALEHLLLALTEDDDAAQVLAASHVNLALLKADVSSFLGGLDVRLDGAELAKISLAVDLKRILEAAAAAASQGRRREINGAIVLAAIVGDGRSSAAHMLRAQGLTFEEAIKALQRALAAQPPPAAPVAAPPLPVQALAPASAAVVLPDATGQGGDRTHAKPDAEDILATARARVQTRAAPGLPPLPPRVIPAPVDVVAAVAPVVVPIVSPEPEAEPVVVREPAQPDESTLRRGSGTASAEPAAWPPDVRRSDAPDFDALQRQIEQARLEDEDAERANAAADAAAYEAAPDVPDYHSAPYAEPPDYQMPPPPPLPPVMPPPLMPSSAGPRVPSSAGSRWPAPVAPAWRDQPEPPMVHQHSGLAPPPLPVPALQPVLSEFAPPSLSPSPSSPPPTEWGVADGPPVWSEPNDYRSGAENGPPPFDPSVHPIHPADGPPAEQVYDHNAFDPGFATEPPPVSSTVSWPRDQVMDAPSYGSDQGREMGYSDTAVAAPDHYQPDWPHREQVPPTWVEPPLQADTYSDGGPGGYVPVPARAAEAAVGPAIPRGARRRKADRAAAGQMGQSIPRRMRAHVASNVDVALGRAEMASLLEGLCEHGGRDVALASLSVKLRAPDGRFLIDPVSPETQWLPDESGPLEGGFSSWRWTVTPLKPGRRRLQLAVWARTASAEGTAVVTPLPDQTIEVRVGRNFARGFARLLTWAVLIGTGWLAATYGGAIYGPVMGEVMKLLK